MTRVISAGQITLRELKQNFGLQQALSPAFFPEWTTDLPPLTEIEKQFLDRVERNFLELMEDPPVLENGVKMVVLSPLFDLAGFYRKPFRIETETSVDIETKDGEIVVRGRIDVLVLKERLWVLAIESKRSDFSVTRAIPQALSYMLGNPETERPTFGAIANGSEFLFLKADRQPSPQYANSRLFSLVNPDRELYSVLQILKHLGKEVASEQYSND